MQIIFYLKWNKYTKYACHIEIFNVKCVLCICFLLCLMNWGQADRSQPVAVCICGPGDRDRDRGQVVTPPLCPQFVLAMVIWDRHGWTATGSTNARAHVGGLPRAMLRVSADGGAGPPWTTTGYEHQGGHNGKKWERVGLYLVNGKEMLSKDIQSISKRHPIDIKEI